MPADNTDRLEQARRLIRGAAYKPAEEQLSEILAASPDDPAANALTGILLCLTQREDQAVPSIAGRK